MQANSTNEFETVKGDHGPRLVLKGAWSPRISAEIKRSGVRELELNYAKGWKGSNVGFLRDLYELEVLEITNWKIEDISEIHHLRTLRGLKVSTHCRTEIDFLCFPLLERVSLEWRPKAKTIFQSESIKRVFINNYRAKDIGAFGRLEQLESLSLKGPKIERIGDLSQLHSLREMCLGNALKLCSLEGIEALLGLERLEINKCRQVTNIRPLAHLRTLVHLELCDNGEIDTLRPLFELKKLQRFYFYESTNIVDGNLAPLKDLPMLSDISFQDRDHYDTSPAEFK